MKQQILTFVRNPKSKHIVINSFGNYLNVFFAFLYQLIFVRIFSPAEFGVLSVLMAIIYLMATAMDFGTTATIYSTLPQLLGKRENLYQFLKSVFIYQTVLAIGVVIVLILFFPTLDQVFFKTGASYLSLVITAVSILFFLWQNMFLNVHFAAKQFLRTNLYLNISNIMRIVGIVTLVLLDWMSISTVMFVVGVFGVSVFLSLVLLDKKAHVLGIWIAAAKRKEIRLRYTLTYFLSTQFLNFGMRLDLFFVSFFAGTAAFLTSSDVGYYGLAQRIIAVVVTSIISITQVLSPSFAAVTTRKQAFEELKHGLTYMMIPVGVFCVLFVTPAWVFSLFFTEDFVQATDLAHTLTLPYIIFSIANVPMLFLLYTVRKPGYILAAYVSFFVLTAAGCFFLIPQVGLMGGPYALLVGFGVAFVLLAVPAYREVQKLTG